MKYNPQTNNEVGMINDPQTNGEVGMINDSLHSVLPHRYMSIKTTIASSAWDCTCRTLLHNGDFPTIT